MTTAAVAEKTKKSGSWLDIIGKREQGSPSEDGSLLTYS